jgi:hypothetical protein
MLSADACLGNRKSMVLLPLEEALISDACLPRSSPWMTKGANDETLPAVTQALGVYVASISAGRIAEHFHPHTLDDSPTLLAIQLYQCSGKLVCERKSHHLHTEILAC